MKSSERVVYIVVISVLGALVLIMGAYIFYLKAFHYNPSTNQNSIWNNGQRNQREETVVAKNDKFDYDGMQDKILDYIEDDEEAYPYLSTCKLSTDPGRSFDVTHKTLTKKAITDVINKLKQASKVEEVKYNVVCPGYSFSISSNIYSALKRQDILNIIYVPNKDNQKSLLVAIDVENYASSSETKYLYSYDNEKELDNFLENLK